MQDVLKKLVSQFPVVTVVGPRQSGKTTLVKTMFPGHSYANLESPDIRDLAENDSLEFLRQYPAPAIIDEIQRVPRLLSYIQVEVDGGKGNGRYILTGSQQLELRASITQSLAGRTAILQLLPFSIKELQAAGIRLDRDELIFRGFMPKLYNEQVDAESLYRSYFQTYVERDARQLVNIKNMSAFHTFIRLLAGRVGQEVNLHSMSGDVGVSSTTLKEWLSALEASFLVFRLPPYFENFGKRHIKSPKIYFTETGLASYLLGIRSVEHVSRDPLIGGLFENMVVLEALKARYNSGKDPDLYFFRDNHGLEIDLVISSHRRLTPVEIKSSRTFSSDFTGNIERYRRTFPAVKPGAVIYSGKITPDFHGTKILNFADTCKLFNC